MKDFIEGIDGQSRQGRLTRLTSASELALDALDVGDRRTRRAAELIVGWNDWIANASGIPQGNRPSGAQSARSVPRSAAKRAYRPVN